MANRRLRIQLDPGAAQRGPLSRGWAAPLFSFAIALLAVTSVEAGEWSVQIGAFRDAPAGYTAAAEEVGPLSTTQNAAGVTRFQIGRYDSRDAAANALAALVGAGYADAFIVKKNVKKNVKKGAGPKMARATTSEPATPVRVSRSSESSDPLADVPESIRSRVVVLDGRYHVKDGDEFTPLDQALRALR